MEKANWKSEVPDVQLRSAFSRAGKKQNGHVQTSNLLFPGPGKSKRLRLPICFFPGREKAKAKFGSKKIPKFAFSRAGKKWFKQKAQTSNLLFPGLGKSKMVQTSNLLFPGPGKSKQLRLPFYRSDFQFAFSRAGKKQTCSDFQFAFSRPGKKQNGSDFQFAFSRPGKKQNGSDFHLLSPGPAKSKRLDFQFASWEKRFPVARSGEIICNWGDSSPEPSASGPHALPIRPRLLDFSL